MIIVKTLRTINNQILKNKLNSTKQFKVNYNKLQII